MMHSEECQAAWEQHSCDGGRERVPKTQSWDSNMDAHCQLSSL